MDENKRCLNCMNLFTGDVCPKCGGTAEPADQAPYLKKGTVLQNRYIVGAVRENNSESVVYTAFDRENNSKILLREYFPQMICTRASNGREIGLMSGGEELFLQDKEKFLSLARKVAHFREKTSVLPIYDIFEANFTAYIVYECSHGGTLREYITQKGKPMSWNMARKLFLPLISVLGEMHAAGIGHYGISPDNLYLYADGKMKLAGFCISDIRREEQDLAPELFSGFAALEQYTANRPLSEATDVYGFTACLFYALTATEPQEAVQRKYNDRLRISDELLAQIPNFVLNALNDGLQVDLQQRAKTFEDLRRRFVGAQIVAETAHKEEYTTTVSAVSRAPQRKATPPKRTTNRAVTDFLTALVAFLLTFGFLWLFGWKIFGVKKDISMLSPKESKPTSSATVSSSLPESKPSETVSQTEDTIPEDHIAVPNLVGKTLSEAQKVPNFTVFHQSSEFSEDIPKGHIISQSISGHALPNSVITVVISKGPAPKTETEKKP